MIREPILSNVPQVRRGLVRLLLLVRGKAPVTLLEEIESLSTKQGPLCKVKLVLDEMEPDEADEFRRLMAVPRYSANAFVKAFKKRGHDVPEGTVQRHRRGGCKCPSPTS